MQGAELADRLVLDVDEKLYKTGIATAKRG